MSHESESSEDPADAVLSIGEGNPLQVVQPTTQPLPAVTVSPIVEDTDVEAILYEESPHIKQLITQLFKPCLVFLLVSVAGIFLAMALAPESRGLVIGIVLAVLFGDGLVIMRLYFLWKGETRIIATKTIKITRTTGFWLFTNRKPKLILTNDLVVGCNQGNPTILERTFLFNTCGSASILVQGQGIDPYFKDIKNIRQVDLFMDSMERIMHGA